jgi:O-acetylhomoserine sulfhydrylase
MLSVVSVLLADKYIAGHGTFLGGAVIDTGNYDWTKFSNLKPAYQVADTAQWGITFQHTGVIAVS